MNEYIGIRELTLTESQVQDVQPVEISPGVRKILQNSTDSQARALVDPNPQVAAQAARDLLRQSFTVVEEGGQE